MQNVFQELKDAISGHGKLVVTGWASLEKMNALAAITLGLRPRVAVEIGCWGGRSLLPVAIAMKELRHGMIHAIDPYLAQASQEGYEGPNANWWGNQAMHDSVKAQFLDMVRRYDLGRHVELHQMKSDDYTPEPQIDLLHVDGQHTEGTLRDVERYAANIRIGGIVMLDDLHWNNNGVMPVKAAVEKLMSMGFIILYTLTADGQIPGTSNDWGVFQRVDIA